MQPNSNATPSVAVYDASFYLSEAVEVMLILKATLRWQTVSQ